MDRLLQANSAKSYVVDAAPSLMARARGERQVCTMVPTPSPAEDVRRLTRERGTLVTERMGRVNRIEGLPASQGLFGFQPVSIDRGRWVERLHRIAIRFGRYESGAASRTRPQLVTLEAERDRILQASRAVTEKVTA